MSRPMIFVVLVLLVTRSLGHAGDSTPVAAIPLVLTQVPRSTQPRPPSPQPSPASAVPGNSFDHARVVVVRPDHQIQVLSEGFHSAADPNLSFDAQRILFAGHKDTAAPWRIWEIGLDGQGLHPVSPENLDARGPVHLSTLFTLDSPHPWFTLMFVGRDSTLNEAGQPSASSLFNLKLDGTELRRLTFNPNRNLDPFQMWDGRVVYAAECHPNQPGVHGPRTRLFAIHIEGADAELFGGEQGRPAQRMPCATDHGLVVFIESDPSSPDGAGQIACVQENRPHMTYRPLTRDPDFLFLHPSPIPNNRILVSRRPARGPETAGVFCYDIATGSCTPVFDSPGFDDLQAIVVAPRNRPDGHSTVVEAKYTTGIFYGLNCYDADPRLAPHLAPGTVRRVRLIEGVPQSANAPLRPDPFPAVPRRLVGEAPVEADGSFNVEVPADIPLQLQALDERGLALATCGWIWVKPGEKRGCIGCHEDPERIPENNYVLALRRPSNRLVLPPDQRRSLSFRTDIVPILQNHCATTGCHAGTDTPLRFPLATQPVSEPDLQAAYANLLAPAQSQPPIPAVSPPPGRFVDPGRARTSRLVHALTGQDTSRPWDSANPPPATPLHPPRTMPPPDRGQALSPTELHTFIQWIDLGAPFDPTPTPLPISR